MGGGGLTETCLTSSVTASTASFCSDMIFFALVHLLGFVCRVLLDCCSGWLVGLENEQVWLVREKRECVCACVCVSVCECERERESRADKQGRGESTSPFFPTHTTWVLTKID